MLYIKYLLSKSIQLITVAMVIGILMTLCLSNIVEAYKMVGIPANGLTNNYYSFSIGEYRDKITINHISLSDMLNFLKKQNTKVLLLKEAETKIFGVYVVNRKFKLDIISGRTFSENDFINRANTIIISEKLKDKCIKKDGKLFYQNDTNYFEVIGVFRSSTNTINSDAIAYYNLSASNFVSDNMLYDNYIFGNFQIDAGTKTAEVVRKLNDYCTVKVTRSVIDNTFIEKLQKTLSSQGITVFPIILIMFLILLNSINIASNWIENRKKEIFVRRLVGATSRNISLMLFKDFMSIITLSYIPAFLLMLAMSKVDLVIFLKFKFSMITLLSSYVTVAVLGLISGVFMLIAYYKNNISQVRG